MLHCVACLHCCALAVQRGDTPLLIAAKLFLRLGVALHKAYPRDDWQYLFEKLFERGASSSPQLHAVAGVPHFDGGSTVVSNFRDSKLSIAPQQQDDGAFTLAVQMYNCVSSLLSADESAASVSNNVWPA